MGEKEEAMTTVKARFDGRVFVPEGPVDLPVGHVVEISIESPGKPQPLFGNCKGKLVVLVEDDEHLEDFKDYLP
jgi:hypothetical protein